MNSDGWTIFETAIGACGLVWEKNKVVRFLLPEKNPQAMAGKLIKITGRNQQSPALSGWIKALMRQISKHLKGHSQDFSEIPLDFERVTEFQRLVYLGAQRIPSGQIRTYKELAVMIGKPKAARAVGQALGKNPFALLVPCHRILASGNKPGGFTAYGGLKTKAKLLACEGW